MLPVFLFKMISLKKYRAGLFQRLGLYPSGVAEKLKGSENIWIHGVSVGEIIAAQPLIALLKSKYPKFKFIISTTTNTGNAVAGKYAGKDDIVIYYPLDFPWVTNRVIDFINPAFFVMLETELWPNFICGLGKKNIPVFLVNGRVSDRSFKGYMKIRAVLKIVFKYVSALLMQTEPDAEKMEQMGAPREKVSYAGSLKFESAMTDEPDTAELMKIASEMGIENTNTVIIGGSTHKREEELLLGIFKRLRPRCPGAKLIIAPRHPERFSAVINMVKKSGFPFSTRKRIKGFNTQGRRENEIIVLDTIGELKKIYNFGSVVFVGKSMYSKGGQNILEPAAAGKAIIFGPHMENFRDIVKQFVDAGACLMVNNEMELEEEIIRLVMDKKASRELGRRAKNLVIANCGAVSGIAEKIIKNVNKRI